MQGTRLWKARLGAATVVAAMAGFAIAGPAAAGSGKLYVSPGGSSGGSDTSCSTAAYSTIGGAVAAAPNGAVVIVCKGVYPEMVSVQKSLRLEGREATIDANGFDNGVLITHSNVEIDGFTIEGATGEGVLAQGHSDNSGSGTPIAHVVIENNIVRNNDNGAPDSSYGECQPSGQIPGDCGEGIHLWSVRDSVVSANQVTGNSGGILLTDEFGPTHGNVIADNVVENNQFDCGITLASHNAGWDPNAQLTMPSVAGVYDNVVRGNVVRHNGLQGEGAGVLIAAAFPLAAAYDNRIVGNQLMNNELAGVTIHSHPGGGYVSGNVVSKNKIGPNNLGGDPDAGVSRTTGVLVFSSDQSVTAKISDNLIYDNHFGVWLSSSTVNASISGNHFVNDAIAVKHG